MDHDHDVGAATQRLEIARLLVAAVAAVLDVHDNLEPEALGNVDRIVVADIVDQDDFVDDIHRQTAIGRFEGARGVVRGHDDDDPGALFHGGRDNPFPPWRGEMIVGKRRPDRVCSPAPDFRRQS